MPKQYAKLLHFGAGGHTLHYSHEGYSSCSCQGYEDPDSFVKPYHWWAHPADQLSRHWEGYEFPADGIPVVDVRQAIETDSGYRWVFDGPILDVDLGDLEIDRLGDVSPLMASAICAYGQGTALLKTIAARDTKAPGPLDSVGVGDYVEGWRRHGARIGRLYVRNNEATITFED